MSELISNVNANLAKLEVNTISSEELQSISKTTFEMLHIDPKNDDEKTAMLKMTLRLHCVNHINFLTATKLQGKFNRMVRAQLKELGADVTTLDSYLNENVRPYFPNHDSTSNDS